MNKKIFHLFITVSLILFSNLFLFKINSSAHTKISNNHIFFTGIRNVSFIVKQHCISPGQPYASLDGTEAGHTHHWRVHDTVVGINIRAGRHASEATVNCTEVNLIGRYSSFVNDFTFYLKGAINGPSKLNFSVKGTLIINEKIFNDIILAQGHTSTRNNWWFGGNDCLKFWPSNKKYYKEQVECISRDATPWCFTRGFTNNFVSTGIDHVKVETHKCIA